MGFADWHEVVRGHTDHALSAEGITTPKMTPETCPTLDSAPQIAR
jgi:hypothetical protein